MRIDFDCFEGNAVERFAAASRWLKENPNSTLYIAPGIYEINGDGERKLYYDIIEGRYGNNSQGYTLNPSFCYTRLLDLDGSIGATVEADGVVLMLDGFFECVSVRNCRNATIRGLTVDYKRKPYTKGCVTNVWQENGNDFIQVRYREDLNKNHSCPRMSVYDIEKRRFYRSPLKIKSQAKIAPYEFVYEVENLSEQKVGNEIYISHFFHSRPVILIADSENVKLKGVTIHTGHGMGITAQGSTDIDIEELKIVPSRGDRFSTTTDATHFISCYGYLRMHGCMFDGHGDDAVNVHNYYHTVTSLGGTKYSLRCTASDGTHTAAADLPRVGDLMIVSQKGTLDEGEIYRVLQSEAEDWLNITVTLDRRIKEKLENSYLSNLSACPDFTFSNCHVSNHFARSVLIKTRRAAVENCIFEKSEKTAVVVSAEENWGEGISSSDILIKNNVFINCALGHEISAVAVFTGAKKPSGEQHGRVTIKGNCVIDSENERENRTDFSVKNTREIVTENNKYICWKK